MDSLRAHSSFADPHTDTERFVSVFKVLEDGIKRRAFPGCSFGVFAEGQIVLADALGHFTYEDDSATVNPETVFDVASLTKIASTTAVAMLLYQRGLLDLETPLGEFLPGFVVGRDNARLARQVTIRHLLAHNSGLPAYAEFFRTANTAAELYRACLELPIEAIPGERCVYSDPGFILLGKALEVLTHEDLASFAQRHIFEPLNLSRTCFSPSALDRGLIPPTEIDNSFRHRRIQGEVQDENAFVLNGSAGHAGLFSNVPDLLCFVADILAGADTGRSSLFTPDTIENFAERQNPEGSSRALGWDTPSKDSSAGHYFSPHSLGHLGYSGCSLWIDLDASIAAVLLTNRTWPDRQCQLIREVRPAFHDAVRQSLAGQQAL